MKKGLFKLMLAILGLNVFTACYGPAPVDYPEPEYGPAPVEYSQPEASADEVEEVADGSIKAE